MRFNPFNSPTYEKIWLNHYGEGKNKFKFNFLTGVSFIKGSWPNQYINIGGNYTSGLFYKIDKNILDYKNKLFVIYDVPQYLQSKQISEDDELRLIKLKLYKGYYVNIQQYSTIEEVVSKRFNSSKSRYNFRRTLKQFNEKYDVSSKMFLGEINLLEYNKLMGQFVKMMEARFNDLDTENTLLPMWDFYQDLLFPLINESKVGLFVIYSNNIPVAMSINFVYDDNLVVATRTFDINYFRLGIGNNEIYYLIDWCIKNKINFLDFSKGERDYKKRWCDTEYYYERHIIYDTNSIKAKVCAKTIESIHNFKQYLRDKKVNLLIHKILKIFSLK